MNNIFVDLALAAFERGTQVVCVVADEVAARRTIVKALAEALAGAGLHHTVCWGWGGVDDEDDPNPSLDDPRACSFFGFSAADEPELRRIVVEVESVQRDIPSTRFWYAAAQCSRVLMITLDPALVAIPALPAPRLGQWTPEMISRITLEAVYRALVACGWRDDGDGSMVKDGVESECINPLEEGMSVADAVRSVRWSLKHCGDDGAENAFLVKLRGESGPDR